MQTRLRRTKIVAELAMKEPLKIIPLLIALLLIPPTISSAGQFKVTYVWDGDTVKAEGHDIQIKVRLAGIDAPETPVWGPYVAKAKEYLARMILNKTVDIRGYGLEPVNRVLGVIYVKGKNINLEMVKAGLAVAYRGTLPKGFDSTAYLEAEAEAREAKRGIWSLEEKYSPREWPGYRQEINMHDEPLKPLWEAAVSGR